MQMILRESFLPFSTMIQTREKKQKENEVSCVSFGEYEVQSSNTRFLNALFLSVGEA